MPFRLCRHHVSCADFKSNPHLSPPDSVKGSDSMPLYPPNTNHSSLNTHIDTSSTCPLITSECFAALNKNPISALIEYGQSRRLETSIRLVKQSGPPHQPVSVIPLLNIIMSSLVLVTVYFIMHGCVVRLAILLIEPHNNSKLTDRTTQQLQPY